MNRPARRALARLEALPPDLLADAIARLVDRLDALDAPTYDMEPDQHDACEAEDMPHPRAGALGVGDAEDAEDDDPRENDDPGGSDDPDLPQPWEIERLSVQAQMPRHQHAAATGYLRDPGQ